jgi:hypothetical protein
MKKLTVKEIQRELAERSSEYKSMDSFFKDRIHNIDRMLKKIDDLEKFFK